MLASSWPAGLPRAHLHRSNLLPTPLPLGPWGRWGRGDTRSGVGGRASQRLCKYKGVTGRDARGLESWGSGKAGYPGWPMSHGTLCPWGPRFSVQAAQGTVIYHLQVHLVAHQLPDVVDAVFDHCWAWGGEGRKTVLMLRQVMLSSDQALSDGSHLRKSPSCSQGSQGPE